MKNLRRKNILNFLIASYFIGISGCTNYYIPSASEPSARLILNTKHISTDTEINIFYGRNCNRLKEGTLVGRTTTNGIILYDGSAKDKQEVSVKIPLQENLVISFNNDRMFHNGLAQINHTCDLSLTFSPMDGHVYAGAFELTPKGCRGLILDITQKPVSPISKVAEKTCKTGAF